MALPKKFQRGGGGWSFSNQNFILQILETFNRAFGFHTSLRICNHINYKKLQYKMKMRGGGLRPFGLFPKIHPIWLV